MLFDLLNEVPNSGCKKDSKGHHYWKSLGVDKGNEIFKCTQCDLCVWVSLKQLIPEDIPKNK
jgi:hypothetical protein